MKNTAVKFELNTLELANLIIKADKLAHELSKTLQEIEDYKLDCRVIKSEALNIENIDLNRSATSTLNKGERVLTSGGKFSE